MGEEIRLDEIERELAVKLAVDEPLVKQDLLALPLREARSSSSAPICSSSCCCAMEKSGSWPNGWEWSERICTASCGH